MQLTTRALVSRSFFKILTGSAIIFYKRIELEIAIVFLPKFRSFLKRCLNVLLNNRALIEKQIVDHQPYPERFYNLNYSCSFLLFTSMIGTDIITM